MTKRAVVGNCAIVSNDKEVARSDRTKKNITERPWIDGMKQFSDYLHQHSLK